MNKYTIELCNKHYLYHEGIFLIFSRTDTYYTNIRTIVVNALTEDEAIKRAEEAYPGRKYHCIKRVELDIKEKNGDTNEH